MQPRRQYVPKKNAYRGIIIAAALFVLLIAVPVTRGALRGVFSWVGTGVLRSAGTFGHSVLNIGSTLRTKRSLVAENTRLNDEISQLGTRLTERDMLARENDELKAAMGRIDEKSFILAAVLGKPPVSLYDTLIIDGGSRVGIASGQIVYANGLTPIGVVESSLASSAVVRLYSSPGEKTDLRLDPSHVDITLVGRGGGSFEAIVPHDLSVAEESIVVSKELGPHIVAKLQKSVSDPRDSFQTLLFSSPVNINELSFVQVRR